MISINTNLSSLITQRSLTKSTDALNLAIERMTTGFKINHASDNAANYSISTNLTTKISSYMVAEENASMGLDMLYSANGSLDQITDKLERLRALATQANNGTYGAQSLEAINSEANALVDEIERIYSNTEYNDIKLYNNSSIERPKPGKDGFIEDIVRRDVTAIDRFSEVNDEVALNTGEYSISSAQDLTKLAQMTNDGLIGEDCVFILANDIDLSGIENWEPIGNSTNKFSATFDGNGYKIKNLKINATKNLQGLFGYALNSTIKNLAVVDANIISPGAVGVLAAVCGDVMNCYTSGTIESTATITGGLAGQSNGKVISCYSSCDITGTRAVGGLIGTTKAEVENCFAIGDIVATDRNVGALCGSSTANIINCYALGNVTSTGSYTGGVCGQANCDIINCYATGDIESQMGSGGLAGLSMGNIINCYATGNVTAKTYYAGGLTAGFDGETIDNSYATGDVSAGFVAGGLVGAITENGKDFLITSSYATGEVHSDSLSAGGLVGDISNINSGLGTISKCYALGDVSVDNTSSVGGLLGSIGLARTGSITINILDSYSKGDVKGDSNVGGLLGYMQKQAGCVIDNCYVTGRITNTAGAGAGFVGYMAREANSLTIKNSYMLGNLTKDNAVIIAHKGDFPTASVAVENVYYNPENVPKNINLFSYKVNPGDEPEGYMQDQVSHCGSKEPFSYENTGTTFQIGINSNNSSQLSIDYGFSLDTIVSLRFIGSLDYDHLTKIDDLLSVVSNKATEYGAVQNRLESALDEIATQYENLVSTRSTIRDADIAEVSSQYIQQQILQQASATLMATANQMPAIALQLI